MKLILIIFVFFSGLLFAESTTLQVKQEKPIPQTKTKAPTTQLKKLKPLHIEYARYEEHVYGQSNRSEVGEQMELDLSVKKSFTPKTYMTFGFEIDPQENSLTTTGESKVQKFDLFFNHKVGNFTIQTELEIDTNKENEGRDASVDFGGISLGFDDDSEGTFISYEALNKKLKFSFFPFNFDSEVGDEFNTWDVARLYFIEGAPSAVSLEPSDGESLNYKTVPGVSIGLNPTKNLNMTLAGGITSFLYPSNPSFNIRQGTSTSQSWEKLETYAAKAKASYSNNKFRLLGEYAWLEKDRQSGALLKSAASINAALLAGRLIFSGELGISQAGRSPYKVAKGGAWFENSTPYFPVYSSSTTGQEHSWVGQTGYAYMLKVGLLLNDSVTPYFYYKNQDENFIFREDESAHKLRNFNDDLSHGGLERLGIGANIRYNQFTIRPDIEYRFAKNPVFNKSAGIQDTQLNSDFSKQDFLLSVVVSYSLKDDSLWGWWKNQGEGLYGKENR